MVNARSFVAAKVHVLGTPLVLKQRDSSVEQLFVARYGTVPGMTHYSCLHMNGMSNSTTSYTRPMKTCSSSLKVNGGNYCLAVDICSVSLDVRKIVLVCE